MAGCSDDDCERKVRMKGFHIFLFGVVLIVICVLVAAFKVLAQISWWLPWGFIAGFGLIVAGEMMSRL